MAERQHRVVVQTGDKAGRKLFEGPEPAARLFVENNFPRTHSDANHDPEFVMHDVKLVNPDGSEEVYHADTGWSPHPDHYVEDVVPSKSKSRRVVLNNGDDE